jgi:hypothetical protein
MISRVNVCMCGFVFVCWIVFLSKKTEKIEINCVLASRRLEKAGFSALLHFFVVFLGSRKQDFRTS